VKRLTWVECRLDEAAVGASLCGFSAELEAEVRLDEERAERLSGGRCERCLEETDEILSLSGSEAVCEGCLDVEADEGADGDEPPTSRL